MENLHRSLLRAHVGNNEAIVPIIYASLYDLGESRSHLAIAVHHQVRHCLDNYSCCLDKLRKINLVKELQIL